VEIIKEIESFQATLVMIGSKGYTAIARFFLGSVAQAVLLHARCSVQIVRIAR
jgi:nucleotide-binding universal stress UspA family protein